MGNLDKQKKVLNKIIGNKSKVQVYDRTTKSSKMIPRGNSSIKSANNSSGTSRNSASFAQRQKKNTGGCGGCSRKRKGG
jgi:hypothetical protein